MKQYKSRIFVKFYKFSSINNTLCLTLHSKKTIFTTRILVTLLPRRWLNWKPAEQSPILTKKMSFLVLLKSKDLYPHWTKKNINSRTSCLKDKNSLRSLQINKPNWKLKLSDKTLRLKDKMTFTVSIRGRLMRLNYWKKKNWKTCKNFWESKSHFSKDLTKLWKWKS